MFLYHPTLPAGNPHPLPQKSGRASIVSWWSSSDMTSSPKRDRSTLAYSTWVQLLMGSEILVREPMSSLGVPKRSWKNHVFVKFTKDSHTFGLPFFQKDPPWNASSMACMHGGTPVCSCSRKCFKRITTTPKALLPSKELVPSNTQEKVHHRCVCIYIYIYIIYIYIHISISSIYHWGVCPLRNWDGHPSKAKNPSIPFHPMLRSQLQRPAESPVPGCLNWVVHAQQKAARKAPEALLTDLAPKSWSCGL